MRIFLNLIKTVNLSFLLILRIIFGCKGFCNMINKIIFVMPNLDVMYFLMKNSNEYSGIHLRLHHIASILDK